MRRSNQRQIELAQARCKHDFFNIQKVDRSVPNRLQYDRGVRLGCAKCSLIRTIWDNGTKEDGPVTYVRAQTTHNLYPTLGAQTVEYGHGAFIGTGGSMTAASRLDTLANSSVDNEGSPTSGN